MKNLFLIVNYNDWKTTSSLIENIKNYKIIDGIIIVDNKSTDESVANLKAKYESEFIHITVNTSNKGYASGINLGCKYIKEHFGYSNVFISNSDIVIYKESDILNLILDKPDDCGIIAPIIREHSGLNQGWKIPTPFQDAILNLPYIHRYLRSKLLFYKIQDMRQPIVDVEAVSGCFFMIDLKSLEEAGYFDEQTFLYYEENIISKRMQNINKKVYLDTSVEVFHNHSISIDKSLNHLRKYEQLKKSQYYFQCCYNNAGILNRFLLIITSKITYFILKLLKK